MENDEKLRCHGVSLVFVPPCHVIWYGALESGGAPDTEQTFFQDSLSITSKLSVTHARNLALLCSALEMPRSISRSSRFWSLGTYPCSSNAHIGQLRFPS